MPLKIEILKHKGHSAPIHTAVIFGREGGTIGRRKDNSLVLPDEFVSGVHARIVFENGQYFLIDTSSNGTVLCGVTVDSDVFINRQRIELAEGDTLRVGDYELGVSIVNEESYELDISPFPDDGGESFPEFGSNTRMEPDPLEVRSAPLIKEPSGLLKEFTIDDFFEDAVQDDDFKMLESINLEADPILSGAPPVDVAPIPQIVTESKPAPLIQTDTPAEVRPDFPLDIEPTVQEEVRAEVISQPRLPDVGDADRIDPKKAERDLFSRFLKGTKLEDPSLLDREDIPEMMEVLGAVFRELVQGLSTILRGRTELKSEIRLPITVVHQVRNNPLKFSPRVEDALKLMLKGDHPSFLGPLEAVREGFEDLMNHQLAMNAGIQAALTEALERFDPKHFAKEHEKVMVYKKEFRCWNSYSESYGKLKDEVSEAFFGKAFAKAYEEQMAKLLSNKMLHKKEG